jgi:hypothetical protein
VLTKTKAFFKYIYDTDESVQYFVDDVCYGIKCLKSYIYGYKIEPYYTSWISVCNIDETYDLNETYSTYQPDLSINFEADNIFLQNSLYDDDDEVCAKKIASKNEWYDNTFSDIFDKCITNMNEFEYDDALVLIQYPEHNAIISNIICYRNTKKKIVLNIPSKVKFLSIKYSHPDMKDPIFFELDRAYFIVGNEILSNTFILRLLTYQPNEYVFDDKYKLEIVDNNINIKTLNSKNYIYLEEKDYRVKEYVYVYTDKEAYYADNPDAFIDGNVEKVNIIENDDDDIYVVDNEDALCSGSNNTDEDTPEDEGEENEDDSIQNSNDEANTYCDPYENEDNMSNHHDYNGMMFDIKRLVNVIDKYVINKPNYSTDDK